MTLLKLAILSKKAPGAKHIPFHVQGKVLKLNSVCEYALGSRWLVQLEDGRWLYEIPLGSRIGYMARFIHVPEEIL